MRTVHVQPDETHLSRLLDEVAAGEEIVFSKAGKPVAKLISLSAAERPKRKLGALEGKYVIPDDFDEPLPDDIQRALEGRD